MRDDAALVDEALRRVMQGAREAIAARGRFSIVLAGGTTPRVLYQRLREEAAAWGRWHVYFGDERCLPADDPSRNSHMAAQAWLDHVGIPRDQIAVIPAELGARVGAAKYADLLHGAGLFDLVLLGLGEDGHTASLFPGHPVAPEAFDILAVHGAPKPPPERISLSAARLSQARQVLFLVSGEGKRDALAAWGAGADIPARTIRPVGGVDVLLGAGLEQPHDTPFAQ